MKFIDVIWFPSAVKASAAWLNVVHLLQASWFLSPELLLLLLSLRHSDNVFNELTIVSL